MSRIHREIMEGLKYGLDEIDDQQHSAMIKKWSSVFEKAGFGSYMIDFSDVESELIEHLGKSILEYFKQKGM